MMNRLRIYTIAGLLAIASLSGCQVSGKFNDEMIETIATLCENNGGVRWIVADGHRNGAVLYFTVKCNNNATFHRIRNEAEIN